MSWSNTVEVVADVGVLGVQLLGPLLIVPERRIGDLGFEHGEPFTVVVDLQIGLGLAEATFDVAQIRR